MGEVGILLGSIEVGFEIHLVQIVKRTLGKIFQTLQSEQQASSNFT